MENVPGMMLGGHASILNSLREEFAAEGYSTLEPQILNAADFGVPQDRRRVFLLGWDSRTSEVPPSYPVPTVRRSTTGRPTRKGSVDLSLPKGPTVLEAISDLPNLDTFEELLTTDAVPLSPNEFKRMETQVSDLANDGRSYAFFLRHPLLDDSDFSAFRSWDPEWLTSSMRTVHTPESIRRFASTPAGETESISRFLRLHPEGLCNTLRAGTGSERGAHTSPRPIHPLFPRVISVREAARLHSFPDWFRFHQTKWHGFRQVGNSVPPLLARAVAGRILEARGLAPKRPSQILARSDERLLTMGMVEAGEYFGVAKDELPKPRLRG